MPGREGEGIRYEACRAWCERHHVALLGCVLGVGLSLRLPFLSRPIYHTDEYRSLHRALLIYGGDLFLSGEPSDKPPLVYLALAGLFVWTGPSERAAVLLNLAVSLASVAAVHAIARRLYRDEITALLAAWFVAASPFHVLFSPTVFLDPPMILLGLLGWLAALTGRGLASGVLGGLALAAKQQGVLFAPLCLASLLVRGRPAARRPAGRQLLAFGAGFAVVGASLLLWGLASAEHPLHFIRGQLAGERQAIGGAIFVDPRAQGLAALADRLLGWWEYEAILLSQPWATAFALVGLVVLAVRGRGGRSDEAVATRGSDVLLLSGIVGFVLLHAVIRLRYVDRYALPLLPLFALALARTVGALVRGATTGRGAVGGRVAGLALAGLAALSPLVAYARIGAGSPAAHGRKIGLLQDTRPGLKPILLRLRDELVPEDEVFCDPFTYPAASFWLHPHRVRAATVENLELALSSAGQGMPTDGRRILVWSTGLPIGELRRRLGSSAALVPLEPESGGVRVLRIDVVARPPEAPPGPRVERPAAQRRASFSGRSGRRGRRRHARDRRARRSGFRPRREPPGRGRRSAGSRAPSGIRRA